MAHTVESLAAEIEELRKSVATALNFTNGLIQKVSELGAAHDDLAADVKRSVDSLQGQVDELKRSGRRGGPALKPRG